MKYQGNCHQSKEDGIWKLNDKGTEKIHHGRQHDHGKGYISNTFLSNQET